MNQDQYYAWVFFPAERSPRWNNVSMLARGIGAELLLRTGGNPMQLYPRGSESWQDAVLRWLFIWGRERQAARRAVQELIDHKLLVISDDGVITAINYTRADYPARPHIRMPISAATRQAVLERDGHACALCGEPVVDLDSVDLDHLVPVSKGGTNHPQNLRVTHASCNRARGNRGELQ